MYKLRTLLITLLVLTLAVFSLAGCGGNKQESDSGDSQATVSTGQELTKGDGQVSVKDLLAKGRQIKGMSCDYIFTAEGITMQGKMWVQGDKVKNETTAEGQRIIMIFDGSTFYSYNPAENMAIKFSDDDLQGDSDEVETPLGYTEDIDNDEVITELETVNYEGVKCRVLSVKDKDSRDETKMWVREDYGIPVRVEEKDAGGTTSVIEYKNIVVGALPADTFKLPAGVQVQDMSEMLSHISETPVN